MGGRQDGGIVCSCLLSPFFLIMYTNNILKLFGEFCPYKSQSDKLKPLNRTHKTTLDNYDLTLTHIKKFLTPPLIPLK